MMRIDYGRFEEERRYYGRNGSQGIADDRRRSYIRLMDLQIRTPRNCAFPLITWASQLDEKKRRVHDHSTKTSLREAGLWL